MDAQNSASFGIADQFAFGGRISLNLWARETKPWAPPFANSTFEYIILPPPVQSRYSGYRGRFPLIATVHETSGRSLKGVLLGMFSHFFFSRSLIQSIVWVPWRPD